MDWQVPDDWLQVIRQAGLGGQFMALLLHGSRVPGWPEPPLPSSDYDILAIGEVGSREHRRVRSIRADLVVVSKRGFRGGQLLSPETHVMLKFGTRVGDWPGSTRQSTSPGRAPTTPLKMPMPSWMRRE